MDTQAILKTVDHTLLTQTATWEEIRQLCDDGVTYGCASVCIPPAHVAQAAQYLGDKLPVCTVIGFPNGYTTTAVKGLETRQALTDGAREIDMVIHLGWVKEGRWDLLLQEIQAVKEACGSAVLKVIIETCLLTEEEKCRMCQIVSESGAEYIKTSTGFSTGGATFADVELMRAHCAPHVKIKAAGGITSLDDARRFLELGADRLGTSRVVRLVKGEGMLSGY